MGHLAARRGSIVAYGSFENKQINKTNKKSSPKYWGQKSLRLERGGGHAWGALPGKFDTS